MQTPIWKKGAVIIAGMALLLGWTARADDSFAPCWRGNSGTTYENWGFATSNNPVAPDAFSNPLGTPLATLTVGPFGAGWQSTSVGGRTGVWDLGETGQVSLSISNYGGSPASWEYVQVQVTYLQDSPFYSAPNVSIAGATLVSSQSTNNETINGFGTWTTMQTVWLIQPSPSGETVLVSGSSSPNTGLLVDQVIVDTRCPVGGDSVPAYRPCWRGLAGTTYQQWSFGVSNNPSSIPAELVTNVYGTPSASIDFGDFSSGYIEEDPFLGCVQGIWDLGEYGTMTLNIPNTPSASGGSYKYVEVQVTQYRDSSIYNTNATVTIAGAVKVSEQQQGILTNELGGVWVVDDTVLRVTPSPASEAVVLTAGVNGSLIDQVTVDTLSLDFPCPTNIVAAADEGECSKSNVTWTVPVVDGCVVTNVVSSPTNGSTFAVGTNLVTTMIMDGEGGIKTCNFDVVVQDTQPPTVTCPADITVAKAPGMCGAVVNFTPTAVDNCSVAGIVSTPPSGSVFPLGLTTVTSVAYDASSNASAPCTFTVRVVDFSGDLAAYRPCWRGQAGSTFQQWAFSVSNNPSSIPAELVTNAYGVPQASIEFGPFSSGYIDQDSFLGCVQGIWDLGEYGTMTLNISNTPSAPAGSFKYVQVQVTQYRDSSIYNTNATVTITNGVKVSEQQQPLLTNELGGVWVVDKTVLRVTPSPASEAVVLTAGVNGSLIDQVTVDTLSLDFPCPTNIVAAADAGECSKSNVTWTVPVVDGCVVTNVVSSPTNGSTFAVGTNPVTVMIMDGEGGIQTCGFNVVVNDTQPPVALCKNIIAYLNAFGTVTITGADVDNGSSDNCGIATRTVFPDTFTCANRGSNSVLFTVVDVNGNSSSCTATVIVSNNLPPTITAPASQVVGTDPGLCSAVVGGIGPTGTNDNCGIASITWASTGATVTNGVGDASGTTFNHGVSTVTYTITDTSSNTATASFTVTVNDTQPPVIICPSNIVVVVSAGQCGTNVSFTVNATDNCGVTNVTSVPASGSYFPVGTTPVTSMAVDSSGNIATCGFNVTVVLGTTNTMVVNYQIPDGSPLGIASSMNISTPIGSITNLEVTLNITNGYNGDLYAYLVHQSGFAVLLNRVGKTAGNPFGYGDPGFNVTLDDAATNGDIHVYRVTLFGNPLTPLGGPLTGEWAPDGRNVDPLLVTDLDPRTAFLGSFKGLDPNGEWTLFVADLSAGNVSTLVSWGLNIEGGYAAPAVSSQPQGETVECGQAASFSVTATGTGPLGYQWYFGTNTIANATNATLTLASAHLDDTGGYSVLITNGYCVDSGSVTSQVAMLIVTDTIPPMIVAPANLTNVPADPGLCSASGVNLGVPVTSDNCGVAGVTNNAPAVFPHGTTTVTWTVTDTSGNMTTATQLVTVVDLQPPVIVCPSNIVVVVPAGQCGTNVSFTVNATDNCGVAATNSTPPSGSYFPVGTTPVTSVAVDSSGNIATCGFNVTVVLETTNMTVVNYQIPDDSPLGIVSSMNISTPIGSMTNVEVTLNITNGYNGDLYAYLVHQSGFAILLNRVGKTSGNQFGYGDPGFNVTMDDAATNGDVHVYRVTLFGNALTPLGGPLTGEWAPDGRNMDPLLVTDLDPRTAFLSSFKGLDPNGEWTLFVADLSAGNISTLVSWGLNIEGGYAAPAISSQPQGETVQCGQTASFSVTATGTGPLGYQWYFGTNVIANATNATLTLASVNYANAGGYSVLITNGYCVDSGSVTSQVAMLNVVDLTPPVISAVTATQNATNVTNCAVTVVQGQVAFSVVAANVAGSPAITMVNGLAADAATFVNQSPAGTYNYIWNVTNTTASGTWTVTVTAADLCNSTNTSFTLCVNKTQITGQVQLQGFVGTGTVPPHTRAVTFVASTNWVTAGPVTNTITLWTNTLTLTFVGDTANYTLTGLPPAANGLSAKTAWNKRSKVSVALDVNSQATGVNLTGASELLGGDITGDNIVNLLDYNVLLENYLTAAPVADINGDGAVTLLDYNILLENWLTQGAPQ